ncbi:MAG: phage tail protein [Clostridia bacterium]|nr:phage tail protein [Clostridia bacterium]
MAGQRKDPLLNYRFKIEIDGIQQAGFSRATGLNSSISVIEYREGTDPKQVRKLSGLTNYGPIILKWGITDSKELYHWFHSGMDGSPERKNISIVTMDDAGNDKARWNIINAWPVKYDAPDFNAKGNDVAIETLEIVHEGITRVE